jgi:ElaB/YqjD/DUF883 family membrane-anchored ribosome-binding protein
MNSRDIQNEIERTRGEMANTLEAIEQKLSPRQLMDQAVETMREIASDPSRIGQAVRDNPVPLALVGLGVGWFVYNGLRGRSEAEAIEAFAEQAAGESPAAIGDIPASYGSAAAIPASGYGAGEGQGRRLAARAGELAEQAKGALSATAGRTREKVSQMSETARRQASHAVDVSWETFQDHPLTIGLMAAVLGAGIGAILPRTHSEARIMGDAAESLIRPLRETGSQLVDKASRLVDRASHMAKAKTAETAASIEEEISIEAGAQGLGGEATQPSTLTH